MTLELPHRSVQIRVNERNRPLAPHERQALASIKDPKLRQVIAEVIHSSRRAQQNLERIAMQFPIQPSNAANALTEGGELPIEALGDLIVGNEEGEPEVLAVGEDNNFLMADSSAPLGVRWVTPEEMKELLGIEGEGGEEEGEKLPPELAEWISVHQAKQSLPDLELEKLETTYTPGSGIDLLVVFWARINSTGVSNIRPSFTEEGEESPRSPDTGGTQLLLGGSTSTGPAIGMRVWKDPGPGVVGAENFVTAAEFIFLPISVKSQGGTQLLVDAADEVNQKISSGGDNSHFEKTISLATSGLCIHSIMRSHTTAPEPSTSRTGTRLLNLDNSEQGGGDSHTFEVAALTVEAGETPIEWTFESSESGDGTSGLYARPIDEE